MRKVILAAALAATFCLSETSHAQQVGGGAGTGAPAGGAVGGAPATQAPGASVGGAQGGPPTSGSFSVQPQPQPQPQGTVGGGNAAGTGGAGQAGQTFYGPVEQGAAGTGTMTGTGGAGTGTAGTGTGTVGGAGSTGSAAGAGGAGGAAGTGTGTTETGGDIATSSPRANERTSVGSASDDVQVEVAQLRAEVDRLRAELDEVKGVRRNTNTEDANMGTGGSGSEQAQKPRPIASSTVEGRVRKVSKRSIEVIDSESGEPYVLRLNEDSRARRGQWRIPVTRIRQGSEVRASFDLVAGDTYATQIDVVGKRRR